MSNSLNHALPILRTSLISIFLATLLVIVFSLYQVLKKVDEDVEFSKVDLSAQFSYFLDDKALLTIDSIDNLQQEFIQSSPQNIPFTLGHSAYWIKLALKNNSTENKNMILHINNTLLSEFDAYLRLDNDKNHDKRSYNRLTNAKDIAQQTFPHIALSITAQTQQILLLRIKTSGPPSIPLTLHTRSSFDHYKQVSLLIFGGFIAIILLMSVYNLVIYRMIKDKVFLVYIGYLLAAFFVLSSINGFGHLLFSQNIQQWLNEYLLFFNYLLTIFLVLFALYFLRYDLNKTKLYKFGIGLCVILAIFSLVTLPLNQVLQTQIFFSFQPLIYIYSLFIITRRLRTDYTWARFYFLSWLPIFFTAAIQPLVMLNYIEYSFIVHNAFIFGVIIEISFISLALAERMRRNEQDRIFDLSYHLETQLPRKSTLESIINQAGHTRLCVLVIQPEQIERLTLYSDEKMIYQLFVSLNKHLSSLFVYNDAIMELTNKHEKICYFENDNCLAIVIDESKNKQSFEVIANSIQEITTENYQINQLRLPLTAVIGIAAATVNENNVCTAQEIIKHAKLALVKATSTPVKWSIYQEDKSILENSFLHIAVEMKEAINNNDFEIYHQPQIDLKTLRVCGCECLVRWHHKTLGTIPPTTFIPIAEDLGLINQLTLWIIKQALTQQQTITELEKCNHMVSINISHKDIISELFYEKVVEIVSVSEISPDRIIFQLTGSSTITGNTYALNVIKQLTTFGITLSIDDFTTSYSSMAHIDELPFQELKIGRRFVENIFDDEKRKIVTETTIKMAKGLGLEVVAEGINSQRDEDTLRKYGCDIGQGYHYSMPLPLSEYIKWLSVQVNGKTPEHYYGEFIPAGKTDI
ncbi:MAG: EAL domain-containing protein (putative c-di-GMP-specific phosphodiesterase class I) [Alteromonadaceae bacterium]|jgi:EAL domain-containing protein (putative c-di-GMP-specific phosphodiesterase class I)